MALWLGLGKLLLFIVLTAVCGGLLALGYVVLRLIGRPRTSLPYGVAIAAAALLMAFPGLTVN